MCYSIHGVSVESNDRKGNTLEESSWDRSLQEISSELLDVVFEESDVNEVISDRLV